MTGFYWLASYPKSGNTWLRLALLSIYQGGQPVDFVDETGWFPQAAAREAFDRALEIESSDLTEDEIEVLRPHAYELLAREASEPLIRKVHDAFLMTKAGEPMFPPSLTLGAIYIVRDPRDVAVSFSHHLGRSIDQAIETMGATNAALARKRGILDGQLRQRMLTWSGHVESWLDAGVRLLLIRYEEMLADPVGNLGKAAAFLGWRTEPDVIAKAAELTSFDRLRAEEQKHGFRERRSRTTNFFRRGVAGGWRDSLTPEQVHRIEQDHGRVMTRLGYALSTEELLIENR